MAATKLTKAGHPRIGTPIEVYVTQDDGATWSWERCTVVGHLWNKYSQLISIIGEFPDGRGEFPWGDLKWRSVA